MPAARSTTTTRRLVALAAGCAGLAFAAPSARADLAAPTDLATHYRCFDRAIPLGLDATMLAVFVDPARPAAPLADALAPFGLVPEAMHASGVPGWTYLELPATLWSPAEIARLVRTLSRSAGLDFVSPVHLADGGLPYVPTRDVLVRFAPGTSDAEIDALLAAHGAGQVLARDFAGTPRLVRARTGFRRAASVLAAVDALSDDPRVEFAQSDAIFWAERDHVPNDPLFPQQWALSQANDQDMDAPEAWDLTIGDPGIVVVVLDSGIDQAHVDIHQIPGQDFTGGGNQGGGPGTACDNHGTAVAGCVAATIDNATGVVGVAPGCYVRAAKIFNELQFIICLPFLESQDSWTVAGINWAASSGARVTNSSWGGGATSAAITTAFDNAEGMGVVHFAAAGNDGTSTIGFPANLASVNAVAALDATGNRASFSTYGAGLFISAPGAGILTTDRMGSAGYEGGNTATVDGTSFASPYAAGVAALALSMDPSLAPNEVESILASTAVDRGPAGYDTGYGWGFINAYGVVSALAGADCPADLDGNGVVDFDDLLGVLANWGACAACEADVDGSGTVDFDDMLLVLSAWGPCA